jgi:hypothetical protein
MPQRASVFCNFYIRVDRETLVSERALDVGSVVFKAMSTKNTSLFDYIIKSRSESFCAKPRDWRPRRNRGRQLSSKFTATGIFAYNPEAVAEHFYSVGI